MEPSLPGSVVLKASCAGVDLIWRAGAAPSSPTASLSGTVLQPSSEDSWPRGTGLEEVQSEQSPPSAQRRRASSLRGDLLGSAGL